MALRIAAARPEPGLLRLPWHLPLAAWDDEFVVPMPRGLSRHVVRIVRLGRETYAIKETTESHAQREARMLRDLERLDLPAVRAQGVVTGRTDAAGEPLPECLITRHLGFSLPYRSLFSHGRSLNSIDNAGLLIDALVVLLVRLHLAGFYWGDVSLSNALFRRNAGEFAAYLVDAETAEWKEPLADRLREYDLTVGCENVFAELLDLQASSSHAREISPHDVVALLRTRYETLWDELTGIEEFSVEEMWRIEQRVERLNELGFDVEEIDIVTDFDGDSVRIQPTVVELGHHCRELQALTGMTVEDNQARRLLNDMAAFAAYHEIDGEERALIANRWLTTIYQPITAMVPAQARGKLEPAEIFHEILEHRWALSEAAGHEVDIFETAQDYIDHVLAKRPEEAVTTTEI